MKKFKVAPQTAKRMKAIVAAAMALTMAVPTSVYFSSKESKAQAEEAVSVPDPIMQVDFEDGFLGESKENGLSVVKSKDVLKFKEYKDANNGYIRDENGKIIYKQLLDEPATEGTGYKYNVVGNQPVTAYDASHSSVLMLDDTVNVPEFKKVKSDKMDSEYPIGTTLQEAYTAQSQVKLNNPFAGKELKDNENGKGVTISYWVKVPDTKNSKGDVSDSSLIVFNNTKREVIQRDDLAKHNACVAYDDAKAKNDTAALADYDMGTQTIVTDASGNTYTLYQNYGKLVRFNPDYPVDKGASIGGGWYVPTKASDQKIEVTDAAGNSYKIASLGGNTTVDKNQYQYFRYLYSATDDLANGYSSLSKVRSGVIQGSMQISAQNDFHFREDNYRSKTITNPDGSTTAEVLAGGICTNPNTDNYNKYMDFYGANQFYFDGDETVTNAPEVWHYVTMVIQNDWVVCYVDGTALDPETSFKYWETYDFSAQNADKLFNSGKGLRAPFGKEPSNVADWPASGTASSSPANSLAITMLDWLTDKDTELFIGGNGVAAPSSAQDKGTTFGTCIDDLTFYDEPLSAEQAIQSYKNAVADMAKNESVVPDPVTKFTFDDGGMSGSDGTAMSAAASNLADSNPSVVSDAVRGNVLMNQTSKASGTSSVVLSKNPFAGKDLTGASVSYWVKMEKAGITTAVSFYDTPKVKDHEKVATNDYGTESSSILYVDTANEAMYIEGNSNNVYNSLKNNFRFSVKKNDYTKPEEALFDQEALDKLNEYKARLAASDEWHFVTAVFTNYEIQLYYDGEQLSNNQMDENGLRTGFGPRFFDGYYQRIYDGYAEYYASSNNQGATPLMTFLTDETTSAYIGLQNALGSETTYVAQKQAYFDNIAYYDVALTANQAKLLYQQESGNNPTPPPTAAPTDTPPTDNPGPGPDDNRKDQNPQLVDGKWNASYGGVTFTADEGVIPAGATLNLGRLGTEDSTDVYSSFKNTLAGIKDFVTKDFVVYTATAKDASGAAISANGSFQLTFDIPSGYDANSVVVVGEDGTVYEGTLSADGTKITITTTKFGNYAVVQKDMSTDDGSTVASASSAAGKTGDTANVVIPFVILALAGTTLVVSYKKKAFQK